MKRLPKGRDKLVALAAGALSVLSVLYAGREAAYYMTGGRADAAGGAFCVVIDAGHGSGRLRKNQREACRRDGHALPARERGQQA